MYEKEQEFGGHLRILPITAIQAEVAVSSPYKDSQA